MFEGSSWSPGMDFLCLCGNEKTWIWEAARLDLADDRIWIIGSNSCVCRNPEKLICDYGEYKCWNWQIMRPHLLVERFFYIFCTTRSMITAFHYKLDMLYMWMVLTIQTSRLQLRDGYGPGGLGLDVMGCPQPGPADVYELLGVQWPALRVCHAPVWRVSTLAAWQSRDHVTEPVSVAAAQGTDQGEASDEDDGHQHHCGHGVRVCGVRCDALLVTWRVVTTVCQVGLWQCDPSWLVTCHAPTDTQHWRHETVAHPGVPCQVEAAPLGHWGQSEAGQRAEAHIQTGEIVQSHQQSFRQHRKSFVRWYVNFCQVPVVLKGSWMNFCQCWIVREWQHL